LTVEGTPAIHAPIVAELLALIFVPYALAQRTKFGPYRIVVAEKQRHVVQQQAPGKDVLGAFTNQDDVAPTHLPRELVGDVALCAVPACLGREGFAVVEFFVQWEIAVTDGGNLSVQVESDNVIVEVRRHLFRRNG